MLKVLLLLGAFLFIVSSGIVIRDWDNPDDEVLVNEDNIIDEDYDVFTFYSVQCSSSSDCYLINPSSNAYELFNLDEMFSPTNKKPYQEKELITHEVTLNGS